MELRAQKVCREWPKPSFMPVPVRCWCLTGQLLPRRPVPLTTSMLQEYETNPDHGKAAAHQKAVLALMDTPDHPEYAHPLFWAPFVVVGEGGAQKKVSSVSQKQSPQPSSAINSSTPSGQKTIQEHCADRPNFVSRALCENRFCKRPEWINSSSCSAFSGRQN
jgi:hypothetical protein